MLSDHLPIDGWKVGPTAQNGFDWAISPHPAHPDVRSLDREEIEALLEEFDAVRIDANQGSPRVLVAKGDPDA